MSWARKSDWMGLDPYDIREKQDFIPKIVGSGTLKRILGVACKKKALQRIVGIKPRWNSKGVGLFLQSYSLDFRVKHSEQSILDARRCIDILNRLNLSPKYPFGWGYPFDWSSRLRIPSNTAVGTCVVEVGRGFWEFYKATGERRWLDSCMGICEHFINNHNIDRDVGKDAICFSYTPIDDFHIHNLNLMVGSFLAKVGKELEMENYRELAVKCANYAILEMDIDGGLTYWGSDQYRGEKQDSYHTGFEARSLLEIYKATGYEPAFNAAKKRYGFFCANFMGDDGATWRNQCSPDKIDIHGCAEAILLHSEMTKVGIDTASRLEASIDWTLGNMRNPDGTFAYRLSRKNGNVKIDRTCYIRWGQAWMLLALVTARNILLEYTE